MVELREKGTYLVPKVVEKRNVKVEECLNFGDFFSKIVLKLRIHIKTEKIAKVINQFPKNSQSPLQSQSSISQFNPHFILDNATVKFLCNDSRNENCLAAALTHKTTTLIDLISWFSSTRWTRFSFPVVSISPRRALIDISCKFAFCFVKFFLHTLYIMLFAY